MQNAVTTYLSLGSNQGSRAWILQQAIFALQEKAGTVSAISSVYSSPAVGFEGDDFLNLCVALETTLGASELLSLLLEIERDFGRVRRDDGTYANRSLDLDLIYYGEAQLQEENLIVPHPRMHTRAFVLKPLADIAPQHYHPVLMKDTRNLLQTAPDRKEVVRTGIRLFSERKQLLADIGFLAIEGNIGSGKTTLAQKISEEFQGKLILERFKDNPFLPRFYEDKERYAFPLEMSFLADRYQQYTEDTGQLDLFSRFMISDYDIYKSLIFANITLQAEEFTLYRKLFRLMYSEVRKPRVYVYLYQGTERLLEQIARRGRDYEKSIGAEYLEEIHRGYFDFMRSTPDLNSLVIDMEPLDFVARETDYLTILDRICAHHIQGMPLQPGNVKV
ncbi:2-amino-4-hydroxy-6-hydroxymethyldihydropteridinediphosphokinase [Robiginitalea myxolifaciens]|uniref:2-amino-4-hydroxy-6-hydroxymethyldihydropteridine pyrophosphokinase n=1 Tax=Robiginitalea myxolifaciens TaxID=400055 RepID=A0A1I6FSE6_9FLAO|nr:2-amino-4-hydroxy-6-hydroxymethyldihydropteridine diphosphokinase [Robiginitalea myxolifaciens]SFR32869.1 2-amino-4-hydroxy-6-hydroxymethyldihydropteridinediphosphokinase [Robiginitalea myxolifaciens]